VQKSVDVPDPPFRLVGLTLHSRSVELVVSERETAPLKPFSGGVLIVDGVFVPVVTEILVGWTLSTKSCT